MFRMDYVLCGHMRWLAVTMLGAMLLSGVSAWQQDWSPIYVNNEPRTVTNTNGLNAYKGNSDNFKILRVEGNRVFIGLKNVLYHMQIGHIEPLDKLDWRPDKIDERKCHNSGRKYCHNYIRVVLFMESMNAYYICGTNAYAPKCRYYKLDRWGAFIQMTNNENGISISPFSPNYNSTALYTDGKLFTATVTDPDERYPIILLKYNNNTEALRTELLESTVLNEPQFVSSDHIHDKVFFFFREIAVENINCGKAIFSRVARVCKNDPGTPLHPNLLTSYFKARLNCSIPGEYPFYFDKIESATEFGQGNHRPTSDSRHRADMVYGVFNTPDNAISGSAVCAFRYSDIENTFSGRFKHRDSYLHNWQAVRWDATPNRHPALCAAQGDQLPHDYISFARTHPLMDKAVPAAGGMPMLVRTGSRSKFTQIAVDWQVRSSFDFQYFDVMFVGTDDGRVIKAINKESDKVNSFVIADIQVLDVGDPVVSLKVLSQPIGKDSLLVVASRKRMISIPVHRCGEAMTCSDCYYLKDPYCGWHPNLGCINAHSSVASISLGIWSVCKPFGVRSSRDKRSDKVRPSLEKVKEIDDRPDERLVSTSTTTQEASLAIEIVIFAAIVSIIGSLILGFFIGSTFQACRYARERDNGFHTDHSNLTPKRMKNVANPGKNNSIQTKPMTKANKV